MKWYSIEELYKIEDFKIKHSKKPKTKWIRLNCVYKIKINKLCNLTQFNLKGLLLILL